MTTVRGVVEYDGTRFYGLQWQPGARTIAGELEKVLSLLFSEPVKITAAGRTDAGVHASGQVISFSTKKDFPFHRLALALNGNLPPDLSVRETAIVQDDFSARFSALDRTYVYAVLNRAMTSALYRGRAYHFYGSIDLHEVHAAARHLLGEHDFRSLCGVLPESGPTVRSIKRIDAQRHGDVVAMTICADGFLHRMVRNIVGTLLEVGNGRRSAESVAEMLQARAREAAGHTAPAHGLYLAGVRYEGFDSYMAPPILGEETR